MNPDYTITPDGVLTYVRAGTKTALLSKNIKAIHRNAFRDCRNTLERLIVPNHITVIYSLTFAGFEKLYSVDFLGGVDSLEDYSFCNCTELHSLVIKKKLKYMGESCLEGCAKLPFINILDTIEYIGDDACKNCTELEVKIAKNKSKIEIPKQGTKFVQYYLAETALCDCKMVTDKYGSIADLMIGGMAVQQKKKEFLEKNEELLKVQKSFTR